MNAHKHGIDEISRTVGSNFCLPILSRFHPFNQFARIKLAWFPLLLGHGVTNFGNTTHQVPVPAAIHAQQQLAVAAGPHEATSAMVTPKRATGPRPSGLHCSTHRRLLACCHSKKLRCAPSASRSMPSVRPHRRGFLRQQRPPTTLFSGEK